MFYKKLFVLLILVFIFFPQISFAICPTAEPAKDGVVQLCNPLTGEAENIEIPTLLGKIIKAVLGIVGSLALVMFIYGGVTWMLAAGNAERVTKGKNILIWATIGLVVIFSAYALVTFIFKGIGALP